MSLLGAQGEAVQPILITLDPEHDTAQHLAQYVDMFHPRLIGLTGSPAAIGEVADAYRVYREKVPTKAGAYTVDHSAFVYLMDREGRYLGFFSAEHASRADGNHHQTSPRRAVSVRFRDTIGAAGRLLRALSGRQSWLKAERLLSRPSVRKPAFVAAT